MRRYAQRVTTTMPPREAARGGSRASAAPSTAPKKRRRATALDLLGASNKEKQRATSRSDDDRPSGDFDHSETAAEAASNDLVPAVVRQSPAFKSALAARRASNPVPFSMADGTVSGTTRLSTRGDRNWRSKRAAAAAANGGEIILELFRARLVNHVGSSTDKSITITDEARGVDTWRSLLVVGRKLSAYEWIRRRWLLKKYGPRALARWHGKTNRNERARARDLYHSTNIRRWTALAGKIRVLWLVGKLAPEIVLNHQLRRTFSVALFYGLEMRTLFKRVGLDGVARYSSDWPEQSECPFADAPSGALYQKVPQLDGTTKFVQLTCEDHLRLVGDGLHRGEGRTFHWRTVGSYHAECDDNNGGFMPSEQGHHAKVKWLLEDERLRKKFEAYVEKHGEVKGEKNMTVDQLLEYTNDEIFKVGKPDALITKPVSKFAVHSWLKRLNYNFEGHAKAEYKDGAMNDGVLDNLFYGVLPFWADKIDNGMLMPGDFDDVTDDADGWSDQAYAKAKARAEAARGPDAKPYLAWSHDEACADSMDSQWRAWVKKNAARLKSKGNSGKKVMAAEMVTIVGNGRLELSPEQLETARRDLGADHPATRAQRTLMLFEIGGEDDDPTETLAHISGEGAHLLPHNTHTTTKHTHHHHLTSLVICRRKRRRFRRNLGLSRV